MMAALPTPERVSAMKLSNAVAAVVLAAVSGLAPSASAAPPPQLANCAATTSGAGTTASCVVIPISYAIEFQCYSNVGVAATATVSWIVDAIVTTHTLPCPFAGSRCEVFEVPIVPLELTVNQTGGSGTATGIVQSMVPPPTDLLGLVLGC